MQFDKKKSPFARTIGLCVTIDHLWLSRPIVRFNRFPCNYTRKPWQTEKKANKRRNFLCVWNHCFLSLVFGFFSFKCDIYVNLLSLMYFVTYVTLCGFFSFTFVCLCMFVMRAHKCSTMNVGSYTTNRTHYSVNLRTDGFHSRYRVRIHFKENGK